MADLSRDAGPFGVRATVELSLDAKTMATRDTDADLERVAADFHVLVVSATRAELLAPTDGTKWTNRALLFHMLFGFLLVHALLVLVKGFGRLPDAVSRTFAAVLNAGTRPFHVLNYLCALPGGRVLRTDTMVSLMESTIGRSPRQSRPRVTTHSSARHALSDSMGSLLQRRHDRRRRVRLPDPALQPPPPPAHHQSRPPGAIDAKRSSITSTLR